MPTDDLEDRIAGSVRALVASQSLDRPPGDVVADAISRAPTRRASARILPLAVASVVAVAVLVALVGQLPFGGSGSMPALVTVNGVEYLVSAPAKLPIRQDLTEHGTLRSPYASDWFVDRIAYSVRNIDPLAVLVARGVSIPPDVQPDPDLYRVLWGPNREKAYPAICAYFEDVPGKPDRC